MSLPSASDSSFHTYTTSTVVPKQSKDETHRVRTPQPTRLERAKRAIEVLERRLEENKRVRERVTQIEAKLDQINKEMDTAYIKIKDELMLAELGRQQTGSERSFSNATTVYGTDYLEKSQLTPPSSIPAPRHIDASLEQRLSGMETSLKRLDNIESALTKLTSRLGASTTKTPSTYTATKSNGDVYGCHEISEIFSQTQAELQRARLAISRMLSMPPVYSKMQNANVSECIRDRSELDMLAKMIDRFLIKLRNSKNAYQNACGDASNCIVCSMGTTSKTSRCSFY
ncbi:hypothetical protein RB195_013869 [Necator americanus]|uniref:Uncharacterized protein n=1 Tax=Necator americanus TaxID=51031 RepID=A0ABR1DXY4_NECAM